MESNSNNKVLYIVDLMPFMKKHFFDRFIETIDKKIKVKDVNVLEINNKPCNNF